MDRANYALANYLARQGVSLELVAHRVAPELLSYPNVTFHRVPKPASSYFLGERLLANEGRRIGEQVNRRGGRVIVNGGNCSFGDINWVHYVHAAYAPEASSMLRRVKRRIMHRRYLHLERSALRLANHVIANSRATSRMLVDKLGIPDEKISVVYYGIDRHSFCPASDDERRALRTKLGWNDAPRVMFVGALGDRRKGFDTMAHAWAMLRKNKQWDAKLIVIGSGGETGRWRSFLEQHRCGDSFEFLGFRSNVAEYLRAADCLVAPTRYEAYGLGVHEAICAGLPTFVSKSAGVAERYPKTLASALVQQPDDPAELCQRLEAWRVNAGENQREWSTFGASLRDRSWDDMADELLQVACLASSGEQVDRCES
jgi:glycosyltransferase involved in cell wall biosynthesis